MSKSSKASRLTALLTEAECKPEEGKTNTNLLLACRTVAPEEVEEKEEEEEGCDQTGGRKSLIFPAAPRGLCQRRAEEDGEERGGNGNVLLNVSNDHKHINHGGTRVASGEMNQPLI